MPDTPQQRLKSPTGLALMRQASLFYRRVLHHFLLISWAYISGIKTAIQ
jgi:hypothetical protein